MKIAYISVYRDGTGYSHAAENMIEGLDHAGVDVVPVWTTLSNPCEGTTDKIKTLEKKNLDGIDAVIQHTLPESFCRLEGVKNIGSFFWETTHFKGSNWQYSCNLMDEIWVTTDEQKLACLQSGVTVPVRVVDIPYNFDKYKKDTESLELRGFEDHYLFYTISDISYRKNVLGLITSYLSEFSSSDNVALVLRCYINGKDKEETEEYLEGAITQLKNEINKPPNAYPPIVLISDRLTDDQILKLHKRCSCFISASRGEGECIPALEAGAMDNWVIVPGWNGPKKLFSKTNQFIINEVIEKPVIGMGHAMKHLYNYDETWYECSLSEMSRSMRKVFDFPSGVQGGDSPQLKKRFSQEVAGNKLKQYLEDLING
jgi:hypothetical protein